MKILVTGGAGFIGSHIVDALVEGGHDVALVDDLSTGNLRNVNAGARVYDISITDSTALKEVFEKEKPEIVNHHAAQTSVRRSMTNPTYDAEVNILGSINILQNCVDHGTRRIVFASTCAVYAEPEYIPMKESHPIQPGSVYGMAKRTVESYIKYYARSYGLEYRIFRYGNVFGPRQNPGGEAGVVAIFTGQMINGVRPTIFGDGTKTRDYVYVGDIVSANALAMVDTGDNGIFNAATGREVSDFEIFDAVRTATGVNIEPIYAEKRAGEASRVSLNCDRIKKVLGWTSRVHLGEGIQEVVTHYQESRSGEA